MSDKLIHARVERISPLTNSILQLILAPDHYIDYQAGQYLQIIMEKEVFSYSIANAPLGSHKYELHIRHSHENPYNQALLADIRKRGEVTIRVPLGECHINRLYPEKPILFIAGGTGFAPIKAMIEHLLATDTTRFFELYWGARSQSDLYMDEKVNHWQAHVSHFQYFSLLSAPKKESLASLILKRHTQDLNDWQIVISGPFDMVYNTRDLLVAEGALPENLFSDAFSFETKNG
ncbi:NAD(P)H-flavin reductase [Legionella oakridgensis]|uniref:2-polyprenylphenol hydroxylase-related flavodoxin oxidoreductase n=2 Tax=Legionella oakridgensis TaxID=29423 RepID=W0BER5_9GAMM|nr:NAD(P)H-flavin reductase [Legionella oakridgensis]AHE68345.1 2-polyprenylphenol hydroxylase-related flavodoxin oxidoreductase [Legionella oakridgensis ATCC 33761 = DSM 21215]ETO92207.1 2-polyprenylphenol hydroxylase [Legionella oakridgensis RV-2-2007]KTD38984.1 CDP-6-deoxy-delta-3,4-glucoseen reductase [Legionella oakridgensis]STY21288.1 CDP-6-deoxy-delta-3,4-glucoseen reductase [Legionella longbeachae]